MAKNVQNFAKSGNAVPNQHFVINQWVNVRAIIVLTNQSAQNVMGQ